MEAIGQYFHAVLFINYAVQAFEQYFHLVLFVMLYKEALTFKSVDETLV